MVRWGRVGAYVVAGLVFVSLVGVLYLQHLTTSIARDNLSNADFERNHQWLPSDFNISYEDVRIPSGGIELAGWWMPATDSGTKPGTSDLTVVLVHGLGSNMSKVMRMWAPHLHEAGYALLSI